MEWNVYHEFPVKNGGEHCSSSKTTVSSDLFLTCPPNATDSTRVASIADRDPA